MGDWRTNHLLHTATEVVWLSPRRIRESGSCDDHDSSRALASREHTFYLPLGEAIITLLDVAILKRLPIEGHVVSTIGRQLSSWRDIVERVLGVRPPAEAVRGSGLYCRWLVKHSHTSLRVLMKSLLRDTQRCISYTWLVLMFADKTSSQVQLLYFTLLDAPWERIEESVGDLQPWVTYTRGYVVPPKRTWRKWQDH